MSPFLLTVTALAAASVLLFLFALYRRLMRSVHPPALLDNDAAAFGSSLILTMLFMSSLMVLGSSLFNLFQSVFLSGVAALAIHVALWSVVRLMVPLKGERAVVGKSILDGGPLTGGGLPAH